MKGKGAAVAAVLTGVLILERLVHLEAKNHPVHEVLALAVLLFLGGFTLTGRLLSGALLALWAYSGVRGATALKEHYLQQPLQAQDLAGATVGEVWDLVQQYPAAAGTIFLHIGLFFFFLRAGLSSGRWVARMGTALAAILVFVHVRSYAEKPGITAVNPESASVLSFISTFFQAPPSLDSSLASAPFQMAPQCPEVKKNVFMILEESTFLPSDVDMDPNLSDFFQGDVDAGPLRVHVVGGTTHLSEFAWITGFPHVLLSGNNIFPQLHLVGRFRKTLPQLLKEYGYVTTVVYPSRRNFRNSEKWYRSVGFDRIISGDELGVKSWRTEDRFFFMEALKTADQVEGNRPHFIYVLTINQHGPHKRHDPRADYIERLRHSARDYRWLKDQLSVSSQRSGQAWLLAWFGDHRTSIELDGPQKWQTWFALNHISAGGGREGDSIGSRGARKQALDIAHLNRVVQRAVGVSWTGYSDIQDLALAECPSGLPDCTPETRGRLIRAYLDGGGFVP